LHPPLYVGRDTATGRTGKTGDDGTAAKWWTDALVDRLLHEDAPYGDLTTEALGIADAPARLAMAMRAPSTLCGVELAADLFARAGTEAEVLAATGTRVAASMPILTAHGAAGPILLAWKVAQTLVEVLSGIATATAAIVDAARAVDPDVPARLCGLRAFTEVVRPCLSRTRQGVGRPAGAASGCRKRDICSILSNYLIFIDFQHWHTACEVQPRTVSPFWGRDR
jgi:hypothetical protein